MQTDNAYERAVHEREVRENFINKKFNKLRKDIQYGPLSEVENKIRKQQYKNAIDKINKNKEHKHEPTCNFCSHTLL